MNCTLIPKYVLLGDGTILIVVLCVNIHGHSQSLLCDCLLLSRVSTLLQTQRLCPSHLHSQFQSTSYLVL